MAEAFKVEDRRGCGHWTCNILWILTGGWVAALWWALFGCIFCITIIGIPCGLQCFKMAKLSFIPFGYRVEDKGSSACCACHCLGNCLWFIPGLIIAIFNIFSAYCKLARLAFSPFGLEVTADKVVAVEVVNARLSIQCYLENESPRMNCYIPAEVRELSSNVRSLRRLLGILAAVAENVESPPVVGQVENEQNEGGYDEGSRMEDVDEGRRKSGHTHNVGHEVATRVIQSSLDSGSGSRRTRDVVQAIPTDAEPGRPDRKQSHTRQTTVSHGEITGDIDAIANFPPAGLYRNETFGAALKNEGIHKCTFAFKLKMGLYSPPYASMILSERGSNFNCYVPAWNRTIRLIGDDIRYILGMRRPKLLEPSVIKLCHFFEGNKTWMILRSGSIPLSWEPPPSEEAGHGSRSPRVGLIHTEVNGVDLMQSERKRRMELADNHPRDPHKTKLRRITTVGQLYGGFPSEVSSEPGGGEETLLDRSSAEESSSNDLGRKGRHKDRSELLSNIKVPPYVARAEDMS
ncbi:hypothetical protein FOZ62_013481 [Perkinsus olseni]|uniref:Inner membrane component domain-containing protein n=1 Tax=Perkinsus olseni TaxID=32597 RepID=A0A7J6SE01_PEROL|nr:hypothetical protein FOZ62_013481 [Perkinsus olseni]